MIKQNLFLLLVCSNLSLGAQGLLKDKAFFEAQTETYQKWLDDTGLGQVLRVQEIGIQEKELSLYLAFPTEDSDLCWVQWEQLKLHFEQQNMLALEHKLFYQLITIMDVPQSVASVQIYDTYDLSKEPYFVKVIYFDEGKVQLDTIDKIGWKSKKVDTIISPNSIGGKTASVQEFYKTYNRVFVFDTILNYSKQRYETQIYDDRYPKVVELQHNDILRFRAEDIATEVLTDERPGWERLIGKNWVKRERLTISVTYQLHERGIKLGVEVDGKYGSGFFSDVGRDGYHLMDDDFEEYLEDYADELILAYANLFK